MGFTRSEEDKEKLLGSDKNPNDEAGGKGGKVRQQCGRFSRWLRSTNFLLYCSHTLSAWGDRMWQFATGMFLVALNPDSLRLTAIYGFASGGAILLCGAIVGNCVDKYPRLNVARTSLVVQNLSVIVSASVVCVTIYFIDDIRQSWGGLETICHMLIIVFAVIADVASVGRQISIERDWIVVICPDTSTLTEMSAFLRRIDLTTKLLAPVVTGQVITYGSMTTGALFIAGWNMVSVFIEYALLHAVYKSVPLLAVKGSNKHADSAHEATETTPLLQEKKPEAQYGFFVDSVDSSKRSTNICGTSIKNDAPPDEKPEKRHSLPARFCLLFFDSFIILYTGWKTYMSQKIVFAGLGLATLYMTVLTFDNVMNGFAKEQGMSESLVGIMMGCAAFVGIMGTVAFPIFRKKVGLERTGLMAFTIQLTCLTLCVASVFAPGSPFDPKFLTGDEDNTEVYCQPLYNATSNHFVDTLVSQEMFSDDFSSMYRPLPPSHVEQKASRGRRIYSPLATSYPNSSNLVQNGSVPMNCTVVEEDKEPSSPISISLLMTGIILSRFGLWMGDLTVTQLLLETPADHERGIVNGVQNSLNSIMELMKFVLVMVLPWPETFGFLILLSVAFVFTGACLYAAYSRKARGHLFHFDRMQEDHLLMYRFHSPESKFYVPLHT